MSPSESQLRAALREGSGKGVDAGVIIANAERQRRARRQRIGYAAAAVVVAAFVGVGGTLLATLGSGNEQGSGSAAEHAPKAELRPAASSAVASPDAAAGGRAGGTGAAPGALICPPAPARIASGAAQAGRLLPAHVSTITACGYSAGARAARTVTFGGPQAARIAAAVNGQDRRPTHGPVCTAPASPAGRITLLPTDAHGRRVTPVTVIVRCPRAVVATNGTVTRYPTRLPAVLIRLVR